VLDLFDLLDHSDLVESEVFQVPFLNRLHFIEARDRGGEWHQHILHRRQVGCDFLFDFVLARAWELFMHEDEPLELLMAFRHVLERTEGLLLEFPLVLQVLLDHFFFLGRLPFQVVGAWGGDLHGGLVHERGFEVSGEDFSLPLGVLAEGVRGASGSEGVGTSDWEVQVGARPWRV